MIKLKLLITDSLVFLFPLLLISGSKFKAQFLEKHDKCTAVNVLLASAVIWNIVAILVALFFETLVFFALSEHVEPVSLYLCSSLTEAELKMCLSAARNATNIYGGSNDHPSDP